MGSWYVTDFIIDEVLTVIWSEWKRKDFVINAYQFIMNDKSPFKVILTSKVTIEDIWEKWNKFAEYPKRPLSFTDASLLAVAEEYSIGYIATYDGEFSGLISVLS